MAGIARLAMPESPRWLVARGRPGEAEALVRRVTGYLGPLDMSLPRETSAVGLGEALSRRLFRFLVPAVVTVAQYAAYDLTAYYLPYAPGFRFGEEAVPYVVFYANLGASVGAFLLLPLIDSFTGGLLTALLVAAAHEAGGEATFYAAEFVNMVSAEWAWASLSVLQSELFPTGLGASVVGLLTSLQGVTGAAIVYVATLLSVDAMLAAVESLVLWHILVYYFGVGGVLLGALCNC